MTEQLTPRQIAARDRYLKHQAEINQVQARAKFEQDPSIGFDIYETYTNLLFRTYPTFAQAESFVNKFPGYELRLKKGQNMNEEEILPVDETLPTADQEETVEGEEQEEETSEEPVDPAPTANEDVI